MAKKQDLFSAYKLTDEDKAEIEKLSKDPRISERVCHSIFQSLVIDLINLQPYLTPELWVYRLSNQLHHPFMVMKISRLPLL